MQGDYCRFLPFCVLTLLTVLMGSCSTSMGPVASSFGTHMVAAEIDPCFRTGLLLLEGFDQPQLDAPWQPNDWVLLGVKVSRGSEHDVWFVRLCTQQVTPRQDVEQTTNLSREFTVPFGLGAVKTGTRFKAPVGRLRVEMYNKDGQLLRTSTRTVPQVFSHATLIDALVGSPISFASQLASGGVRHSDATWNDAVAGTMTMLQVMGGSRALAPIRDSIREHVVKRPSVLGLLLAGLRINVEAKIDQTKLVQTPWSAGAALSPRSEAMFPILLSGQRLMDCRVVVGPASPPYNLTAGTLLVEAAHPDKPLNRLTVCMLAAKRMGLQAPGSGNQIAMNK